MPSTSALRWMLGASLGLGAIDLLVIDLALAPEVVADTVVAPRFVPARTPILTATATPITTPDPVAPPPAAPPPPPPPPSASPSASPSAAPAPPPAAASSAVKPSRPSKARVYFATMSATLDDTARTALGELDVGAANKIVLEGHADERGDAGYNRKLSRKRALAVHAYLLAAGAERSRIEVRYAGEAGADDPDLWRDRRVDIQIIGGSR